MTHSFGDRVDAWGRILDEGDALTRVAGSAARATATGADETESVRVTLDPQGRVAGVSVAAGWRQRLGADGLSDAVLAATRDASVRRLEAWGEAYGGDDRSAAESPTGTNDAVADNAELQRRL